MWLRDLKDHNRFSERPYLSVNDVPDDVSPDDAPFNLTKDEHARVAQASQALHNELAAEVCHIDPAEYSDERIEALLAQAQRNSEKRSKLPDD